MAKKLKVYNDRPYDIGVMTLTGLGVNIRSGSFALLDEDDIPYIESLCLYNKRPFATGKLRVGVEDEELLEEMGVVKEKEFQVPDKTEITKKLKGTGASIRKWMSEIEDNATLAEIYNAAVEMDLTTSKMKAVREMVPEALYLTED